MIEFTGQKLRDLGFDVECRKIGVEEVNGEKVPFPPVILATKGNDPKKNTILISGHLDVKPAKAVSMKIFSILCFPICCISNGGI